jgi:hypothetical protein
LIPGAGSASGLLLTGLSREEWRIIDAFEAEFYDLLPVALTDERKGWAYVYDTFPSVSSDDWDKEEFAQKHLGSYAKRCKYWRFRYE